MAIKSGYVDRFVGTHLQMLRVLASQDQDEFASLLHVTTMQLQSYESGEERVPAAILLAAAHQLGTKVSALPPISFSDDALTR